MLGFGKSHLREGAVIPDVTMMGETIADIAKLALLHVLLDGVELLFFRDLRFVSDSDPI